MQYVKALIDEASKICMSDAELARRLHVSRAAISMMRREKIKVSPEMAAMLAEIAGSDAVEAMIAAVIEGAKGTAREALLKEILGKERAAGGGGMCHISYSGDLANATETIATASIKTRPVIHRIYSAASRVISYINSGNETGFMLVAQRVRAAALRLRLRGPAAPCA